MAILAVKGVVKHFGGVQALQDVDLEIGSGELVGLIGPNGSGKTTLFNCITGELKPESGAIYFHGTRTTGWRPHQIALRGLIRTYQQTEVFPEMSAMDNLLIAGQEHQRHGLFTSLISTASVREGERSLRQRALGTLNTLGLMRQAEERAGRISYGQRKLLAIGMALMAEPRLLLLDEPTAAVNPTAIGHIVEVLRGLHRQGLPMLIVEHNLPVIMDLCERVVVLNGGRKLVEGSPELVRSDPRVIEAYFGS